MTTSTPEGALKNSCKDCDEKKRIHEIEKRFISLDL